MEGVSATDEDARVNGMPVPVIHGPFGPVFPVNLFYTSLMCATSRSGCSVIMAL